MIKHIVMWRLRGSDVLENADARQRVKQAFDSLRGRIPGLLSLEIGLDSSGVDYACDVVLVTEFESKAALDAYATHPEHTRARAEIEGLRVTRHQVDYEVVGS